jgi:hypothetical protein
VDGIERPQFDGFKRGRERADLVGHGNDADGGKHLEDDPSVCDSGPSFGASAGGCPGQFDCGDVAGGDSVPARDLDAEGFAFSLADDELDER